MNVQSASEQDYLFHRDLFLREHPKSLASAQKLTAEQAQRAAEQELSQHLPDGQKTAGHFFYVLYEGNEKIAHLWLGQKASAMFIYDIYVLPAHRNRGFGSQLLDWVRQHASESGANALWLHVFGDNQAAVAFYQRAGFFATNISMRLDIEQND